MNGGLQQSVPLDVGAQLVIAHTLRRLGHNLTPPLILAAPCAALTTGLHLGLAALVLGFLAGIVASTRPSSSLARPAGFGAAAAALIVAAPDRDLGSLGAALESFSVALAAFAAMRVAAQYGRASSSALTIVALFASAIVTQLDLEVLTSVLWPITILGSAFVIASTEFRRAGACLLVGAIVPALMATTAPIELATAGAPAALVLAVPVLVTWEMGSRIVDPRVGGPVESASIQVSLALQSRPWIVSLVVGMVALWLWLIPSVLLDVAGVGDAAPLMDALALVGPGLSLLLLAGLPHVCRTTPALFDRAAPWCGCAVACCLAALFGFPPVGILPGWDAVLLCGLGACWAMLSAGLFSRGTRRMRRPSRTGLLVPALAIAGLAAGVAGPGNLPVIVWWAALPVVFHATVASEATSEEILGHASRYGYAAALAVVPVAYAAAALAQQSPLRWGARAVALAPLLALVAFALAALALGARRCVRSTPIWRDHDVFLFETLPSREPPSRNRS